MAILLPKVNPDQIKHRSERDVAEALVEALDQDWIVYHSFPWLQDHEIRSGALLEGEADFVILHPVFGLLVLEVKGGSIQYDSDSGRWLQNSREMKESPFEQAGRNMHALLRQIRERLGIPTGRLPFNYGYAVCFPDSRFEGTLPPGAHPQVILGADDLRQIGPKVQAAFRSWRGGSDPLRMDSETFKEVRQAVMGTFRLIPSLSRTLLQEGETLLRLTEEQKNVMDGLALNRRVAVEGVAGSGKTLLALYQAQKWCEQGKKTLMLCFNKYLAHDLQSRFSHPNLTIRNFHTFASEVCKRCGIKFSVPSDPAGAQAFWERDAADLLSEALMDNPHEKFDAIVVDEGQDFGSDYWIAVEDALREMNGPLYYFYDRSQSVFQGDPGFPQDDTRFVLRINCRNTKAIASACAAVINEEIKNLFYTPVGVEPSVQVLKSDQEYPAQVQSLLDELLREEKLRPSQLAILRPFSASPLPDDRMGKHRFTSKLDDWYADKGVWNSTIRSFKGLESDVLILVDLPDVGERHFDKSDLYVACSRARLRLYIFTTNPNVQGRLTEKAAAA